VRVANAGVAGDTTAGMLRRLPGAIGKDTRVLILQAGGNDARRGEGASTGANVAAIEAYARQRGIAVVTLDQLGRIAPGARLSDGPHFSAEGHAAFAAYLAPQVRAAAACGG
jgi:acyl-CoA thioesterase-1